MLTLLNPKKAHQLHRRPFPTLFFAFFFSIKLAEMGGNLPFFRPVIPSPLGQGKNLEKDPPPTKSRDPYDQKDAIFENTTAGLSGIILTPHPQPLSSSLHYLLHTLSHILLVFLSVTLSTFLPCSLLFLSFPQCLFLPFYLSLSLLFLSVSSALSLLFSQSLFLSVSSSLSLLFSKSPLISVSSYLSLPFS